MDQETLNQFGPEFLEIFDQCKDFTMLDWMKAYNLYSTVVYILDNDIPGDFVECGVWRGGSCMIMALTALKRGKANRKIHLYDTYEGMTRPTGEDIRHAGIPATPEWVQQQTDTHNQWCYASLEEVQANLSKTQYPSDLLTFIKGPVEETIPATMPGPVSLLRLDTDFYTSSYHEMVHLYPLLNNSGILILDDYKYWQGQEKAVTQYFQENEIGMMLNCMSTCATGTKVYPVGFGKDEAKPKGL